jgi:hypothetical protein
MSKSIPKNKKSVKTKNSKITTTKKSESKIPYINISAILAPHRAKHITLPERSGYELVETKADPKEQEERFLEALTLLKGILFKRDQPYRTLLPFSGSFSTNSSGVLNTTTSLSTVVSTQEWSSVTALFDEVFVHAMHVRFFPVNDLGAGVGYGNGANITGNLNPVANTELVNGPICMCSLFAGSPTYSSASALVQNSTLAVHTSGKPWKYVWRNNTRFDPRGPDLSLASAGWSGWIQVASAANLVGQIQYRALTDPTFGPGSGINTLGYFLTQYDCSFRSRS